MRMRLIRRCTLAAAVVVLATMPADRTHAQNSNGNFDCFSLAGGQFYNPCTGEDILITDGQACIGVDTHSDGSGGFHLDVQFRSDFTAVGLTTGRTYSEHNAAHQSENVNANNPQN